MTDLKGYFGWLIGAVLLAAAITGTLAATGITINAARTDASAPVTPSREVNTVPRTDWRSCTDGCVLCKASLSSSFCVV